MAVLSSAPAGADTEAPTNHLVDDADDTTTGRLTADDGFTAGGSILAATDRDLDIGSSTTKFGELNAAVMKVNYLPTIPMAISPTFNVGAASGYHIGHRNDGAGGTAGSSTIDINSADQTFPSLVLGYTNTATSGDQSNITTKGGFPVVIGGVSNFFNGGFNHGGFVGGLCELEAKGTGAIALGTAYVGVQASTGTQSRALVRAGVDAASTTAPIVMGTAGMFGNFVFNGAGSGNVAELRSEGNASVNMGASILAHAVSNQSAISLVSGDGSLSAGYVTRGIETVSGSGSLSVLRMLKTNDTQGVTVSGDGALSVLAHTGSGSNVNAGDGSVMIGRTTSSGILNVGASAPGSVVVASVTGSTDASVTAANAMQLGVGTNSTASSFQVGDVSSSGVLLNGANGTITSTGGRIRNTSRYTTTQTILVTDDVVFANTDSAAWTATLPAGVEGQTFKIINSGSSANNLTVAPNGSEHLLGVNSNFTLGDGEALIITYNSDDGWY